MNHVRRDLKRAWDELVWKRQLYIAGTVLCWVTVVITVLGALTGALNGR
jgi:hypothetical protein